MTLYPRIPSQELFPTKGPVPTDRLIGRDDEVTALVGQLRAGSHQILSGPRRTGKSSVCDAAVERIRSDGAYVVAVDLFRIGSLGALANAISLAAISNRPAVRQVLPALARTGRRVGQAARVTATLKNEFGVDIEIVFGAKDTPERPEARFGAAIELLEKIAVADGHPVVLYLDEFQDIDVTGGRFGGADSLTKRMRAILQRSPHVTCLFAGSVEHMMRDIFTSKNRAMYQFGGFFELGPIDRPTWVDGLREIYMRDVTTITDAAVDLLLGASGEAPRATMLIAQQSHIVVVEKGVSVVDSADVQQGIDYAMAAERPTYDSEILRIRDMRSHALDVALRVAKGDAPYGVGLSAMQAKRGLDALRDAGVIIRRDPREWAFVDPLFRRYLAESFAL